MLAAHALTDEAGFNTSIYFDFVCSAVAEPPTYYMPVQCNAGRTCRTTHPSGWTRPCRAGNKWAEQAWVQVGLPYRWLSRGLGLVGTTRRNCASVERLIGPP